jgi:3-methyladenine DNA glycosylase AlkD
MPTTAADILTELSKLGSESTKKTLIRHGAREPFYGVKVEDLKKIQKRVKQDYALSLALYDTGNSDAMYLAGLIADPAKMTKADLRKWVKAAYWHMISGSVVAAIAAESPHGRELALEWMDSPKEQIANAGWCTYAFLVSLLPDDQLDLAEVEKLLNRVQVEIHGAQNRVRYAMNSFVIAVGGGVGKLNAKAKAVSKAYGAVEVDMGDTACNVPDAGAYIAKIEKAGKLGQKRKRCMC